VRPAMAAVEVRGEGALRRGGGGRRHGSFSVWRLGGGGERWFFCWEERVTGVARGRIW
jgi:hypothetical protein